jgi:hypothetical protein
MIDWTLALSTASQAIKFANDLRLIDKEVSQAELKLKVADLTGTLADLKMILTEARRCDGKGRGNYPVKGTATPVSGRYH